MSALDRNDCGARTRRSLVFAASVWLMLAAACTGEEADDADRSPAPEESASASEATSLAPEDMGDPVEAGVAAYLRFWQTVTDELAAPDGDFTAFEAVAGGQALEYAIGIEQRGVDEGIHGSGAFTHEVEVKDTLITDQVQQVVVTDCSDSSDTQVLDADGDPVAGEEYGPSHIEARIELIEGRWLVTAITVEEIGSCEPAT